MPRRIFGLLIGALAFVVSAHGVQPQPVEITAPMDNGLRQVMAELHQAALDGDTKTTESLMTDGYIQTDISGHLLEKTEWLETYSRPLAKLIKAGVFHWDLYRESNIQVRMYGDAAVVMGVFDLKGRGADWGEKGTWVADPKAHPQMTLRFTRVFVRDHGAWKLAAIHNAPLPPPASSAGKP